MTILEFAKWKDLAESLGAKSTPISWAARYRAVLFDKAEDRNAFYDLSVESYPDFKFFCGNIDGTPCVQAQP